ncbi:unnamed protein product, partial [Didymodactylos carnosus]
MPSIAVLSTESSDDGDASGKNNFKNPSLIFVLIKVNNKMMNVMIDTGATNTIITEEALRKTKHQKFTTSSHHTLQMADGIAHLKMMGTVDLEIKIKQMVTTITAIVVKTLFTDCIIGTDYIKKYAVQVHGGKETVTIQKGNQFVTVSMEKQVDPLKMPLRLT